MLLSAARLVAMAVLAGALAGCHPLRDARPPFHEPATAKPAPAAQLAPPGPADRPAR